MRWMTVAARWPLPVALAAILVIALGAYEVDRVVSRHERDAATSGRSVWRLPLPQN